MLPLLSLADAVNRNSPLLSPRVDVRGILERPECILDNPGRGGIQDALSGGAYENIPISPDPDPDFPIPGFCLGEVFKIETSGTEIAGIMSLKGLAPATTWISGSWS